MMFKKPNQKTTTNSLAAKVEKGEIELEAAQKTLSVRQLEAEVADAEEAARDHGNLVDLRNTWGKVILGVLITTIISDFFLIGMVGSGIWSFEGNTYFLNVVVTEHLIQIFGLVLIVLKSLFPKGEK